MIADVDKKAAGGDGDLFRLLPHRVANGLDLVHAQLLHRRVPNQQGQRGAFVA